MSRSNRDREKTLLRPDGAAKLLLLTEALGRSLSPEDVATESVRFCSDVLGASACTVSRLTDGGDSIETVAALGFSADVLGRRRFALDARSPVSDALRERSPVLLPSLQARMARYPHLSELHGGIGQEGLAVLPLATESAPDESRLAGALSIYFGTARAFDADERSFLLSVATQVAQSFERARLYRAEQKARLEARALFELAERLVRSETLGEVTTPALDAIAQMLQVSRSAILLFDPDRVMRFKAWRGISPAYRAAVEGHTPWTPEDRDPKPVIVADVELEPSLSAFEPVFERERIRSLTFVPLVSGARVIGKFMLYDERPRAYTSDEMQICSTIATQVAQGVVRIGLLDLEREARERAEAEGARAAAALESAREADRRKDEFLAMLSHELRNPLAPITTGLHLIRRKAGGNLEREIALIDRQVTHLTRLVDDLLDLSRITRGKVQLKREPIDLGIVVAKSIELAGPLIEHRRHRLVVDVADRLPLEGDTMRLAQVFANLLTNAAKYTDPGGRIEITAHVVSGAVEVAVRDNGIGIKPELLPHMFERFVQAEQNSERAQGGLGIGLSLVKSLVEMHGGTVAGHSGGPGTGSTFTVILPLAATRPDAATRPETTPLARAERPQRILVVDDIEDVRVPLAEALRDLGHDVAMAHDGPSALDEAARFKPEAAIVDIGLPVMDGYELASRLRELIPRVRLLAVTGYGLDADREKTRAAGFERHFVKPVTLDELLVAIDDGAA